MVEQPLIYSDINNRPCPRVTRGRIDGVRLIFLSICRHVPTLTVRCSTFLHHLLAMDCLLLCDFLANSLGIMRNWDSQTWDRNVRLTWLSGYIMRVRTKVYYFVFCFSQVFFSDFAQTFLVGINRSGALTRFIKGIKTYFKTFDSRSTICKSHWLYHFHQIFIRCGNICSA